MTIRGGTVDDRTMPKSELVAFVGSQPAPPQGSCLSVAGQAIDALGIAREAFFIVVDKSGQGRLNTWVRFRSARSS